MESGHARAERIAWCFADMAACVLQWRGSRLPPRWPAAGRGVQPTGKLHQQQRQQCLERCDGRRNTPWPTFCPGAANDGHSHQH
eukprot:scaffold343065_cov36-Prasinocladus_malaysianus.AAC.1